MGKKTLKFVNKSPNVNPCYSKSEDSGFDLRAWISNEENYIELRPLERRLIHTGLYFELPEDTEIQVRPRSGAAIKIGLSVVNTPGTVDRNYTGEVCIVAINLSYDTIRINNGDRIAQAVLMPVYNGSKVTLENVSEIEENAERGSDGFGSTGKN